MYNKPIARPATAKNRKPNDTAGKSGIKPLIRLKTASLKKFLYFFSLESKIHKKTMKVLGKQRNSRMCFICGMENPVGLKSQFYNMEDGGVLTIFKYLPVHQSFPQRVHGGLIATMLDELTLRGYWVLDETMLGVTTSINIKFRKPVPYDVELLGRGIVVNETSRYFKTYTAIMDRDGKVFAEAESAYIKLPAEKIAAGASYHDEMRYLIEDGLTEIDAPKI